MSDKIQTGNMIKLDLDRTYLNLDFSDELPIALHPILVEFTELCLDERAFFGRELLLLLLILMEIHC